MLPKLDWFDYTSIDERITQLRIPVNEYGYDPFGLNLRDIRPLLQITTWLYRNYFRVETFGIENVPSGKVMLIANHAGQLPVDGAMIGMSVFWEASPPRIIRGMVDKFVPTTPFVGTTLSRAGQILGLPENCGRLMDRGAAILVFPEGVRGIAKPITQRYKLVRFGTGFARLALEFDCPIIPVGVVGSEEQIPALFNSRLLSSLFNTPSFPITPFFPWLGPLGILPLPTKYRIYFGEPMTLEGTVYDDDAAIIAQVNRVRDQVQALINRGLRERKGVFFS